jgi:hypothetical protein
VSANPRFVVYAFQQIAERRGWCGASSGRAGQWLADRNGWEWNDHPCLQLFRASLLFSTILAGMFAHSCWAQDLAPRAYLITPLHSNAVNLTYSFFDGGVEFNGVVPIEGATGTYSVPIAGYYHSFGLLGRSANIAVSLPTA